MISEETIQKVITASDIVAVIGSFFPLKRGGMGSFKALCPFHNEKSPSFTVSSTRQAFYCFGCGAGGGVVRFIQDYQHLGFPDAIRWLADKAGIPVIEEAGDAQSAIAGNLRKDLLRVHSEVAEWMHQLLLKDKSAERARAYWRSRGLDGAVARRWKIGYAPAGSQAIMAWAKEKKIHPKLLADAGIIKIDPGRPPWFYFQDRLIFPIFNDGENVIGFSGRLLDKDAKAAKYLNSPETAIFNKGRQFFGIHKTKRPILKSGKVIVCEGQLDLITCFEHGIENVVCTLGTALTENHARQFKQWEVEATLCFDADAAGLKASSRAFRELAKVGVFAKVMELPVGEDPDSLIRSGGVEAFTSRLEQAKEFINFQIDRVLRGTNLSDVRDRLRGAAELAGHIAHLSDKTTQEDAINLVVTRFAVSPEELRRQVFNAARDAAREAKREAQGLAREEASVEREEPIRIGDTALRMLTKLALTDANSRAWLKEGGRLSVLEDILGSELLFTALKAGLDLAIPASVTAFLSTLSPREEAFFGSLLAEPSPAQGIEDAQAALTAILSRRTKDQIDLKQTRLRSAGLDQVEVISLTQELVRLKAELAVLQGKK